MSNILDTIIDEIAKGNVANILIGDDARSKIRSLAGQRDYFPVRDGCIVTLCGKPCLYNSALKQTVIVKEDNTIIVLDLAPNSEIRELQRKIEANRMRWYDLHGKIVQLPEKGSGWEPSAIKIEDVKMGGVKTEDLTRDDRRYLVEVFRCSIGL